MVPVNLLLHLQALGPALLYLGLSRDTFLHPRDELSSASLARPCGLFSFHYCYSCLFRALYEPPYKVGNYYQEYNN